MGWGMVRAEPQSPRRTGIADAPCPLCLRGESPHPQVGAILADLAGTTPASGTARYYFQDNIGSTRQLRASDKSSLYQYEYTPYGESYAAAGTSSTNYQFTGKELDSASGLYYFPYRYYSPGIARWMTRDPLGMVDGPNVYGFVKGRPVSVFDVLGLATAWLCTDNFHEWNIIDMNDDGQGFAYGYYPSQRPPGGNSSCQDLCNTWNVPGVVQRENPSHDVASNWRCIPFRGSQEAVLNVFDYWNRLTDNRPTYNPIWGNCRTRARNGIRRSFPPWAWPRFWHRTWPNL